MGTFITIILVVGLVVIVFQSLKGGKSRSRAELQDEASEAVNAWLAKLPAYKVEIMKEEFPNHEADITFAKVIQLTEVHADLSKIERPSTSGNQLFYKSSQFGDALRERIYKRKVAENTGVVISDAFRASAVSDPDAYYAALERVYAAAIVKLEAGHGTLGSVIRSVG